MTNSYHLPLVFIARLLCPVAKDFVCCASYPSFHLNDSSERTVAEAVGGTRSELQAYLRRESEELENSGQDNNFRDGRLWKHW